MAQMGPVGVLSPPLVAPGVVTVEGTWSFSRHGARIGNSTGVLRAKLRAFNRSAFILAHFFRSSSKGSVITCEHQMGHIMTEVKTKANVSILVRLETESENGLFINLTPSNREIIQSGHNNGRASDFADVDRPNLVYWRDENFKKGRIVIASVFHSHYTYTPLAITSSTDR